MRIAVIVDDLDESRRRHCFWEYQLKALSNDIDVELVCLPVLATTQQDLNVGQYGAVILNWDVLNGDEQFGAMEARQRFQFYLSRIEAFVRDEGGVVIMESQSAWWAPLQECYDATVRGELKVLPPGSDGPTWSEEGRRSKAIAKHPLLRGVPLRIQSYYAELPADQRPNSWFPVQSVGDDVLRVGHYPKLYSGAIASWTHDWLPLVYTADGRHPVLLVKSSGAGFWIASTMFLASSNVGELLKNLVIGSKVNAYEIRQFHRHQERLALLRRGTASGLILAGIPLAAYLALAERIVEVRIAGGDTIAGWLVLSTIFLFLTVVAGRAVSFVWPNVRLLYHDLRRRSTFR